MGPMESLGPTTGTPPYEHVPARPSLVSWLILVLHGALGVASIGLAANEESAAGKVAFANDAWRVALGVSGAWLLFVAARALYRNITGWVAEISPEVVGRHRWKGLVLLVLGIWFFGAAQWEGVARETFAVADWAETLYTGGGIYLGILGLVSQLDPTRYIRAARVRQGQGVPGRATILGSQRTGVTDEGSVQVSVDFEIDAANSVYSAQRRLSVEVEELTRLVPGATLDVIVDPADPSIFEVDWKTWRPPR